MPRSVASRAPETSRTAFADDVSYYLTQSPRQLPSQYLYDDLGSVLFEAICRLPWYRITRIEQRMLNEHASAMLGHLPKLSSVVELGPGSGEKLLTLMAPSPCERIEVHLVDVSAVALDRAATTLSALPFQAVVGHQSTYETGLASLARRPRSRGRMLVVFLGSNIGNFDQPGAEAFLLTVRSALSPGDAFLVGTDLVKPEADLLLAYNDPLGVTAAFNRNLLVRINRELGGDFHLDRFAHRAVWNGGASRIEMHLVSRARQRVRVAAADLDITFEADEPIWTESSYKYRVEDVAPMLSRAGFRTAGQWVNDGFALTLAEAI